MNDWWSFDPEGKSWRRLRATGDAPTPRRDHWGAVELGVGFEEIGASASLGGGCEGGSTGVLGCFEGSW